MKTEVFFSIARLRQGSGLVPPKHLKVKNLLKKERRFCGGHFLNLKIHILTSKKCSQVETAEVET